MNYFENIKTLEELRTRYRQLAFLHHPDKGGEKATFQEIANQYEKLSKRLINGNTNFSEERKKYEHQASSEIIVKINLIINLEGLIIEIIGSWIWVTGNTYFHKDALKTSGFSFMRNKSAWCWHSGEYRKASNIFLNLQEIRDLFGSETVDNENKNKQKKIS